MFLKSPLVVVFFSAVVGCSGERADADSGSPGAERGEVLEEPRSGRFEANGLTLSYVEWGAPGARPLILLHHVNSHARAWDAFARSMSADYRVIAMDMRGHGDSDWAPAGAYSTEDFASDVAGLAEHLDLQDAIVLGGSTGGRVALVFAGSHRERVSALVLEDVGPVRQNRIAQGFADRLAAGDPEFDTIGEWAEELRGSDRRRPIELYRHLALYGTRRLPNGRLGLKRDPALLADLVALELWDYVRALDSPTLLILGGDSNIVDQGQQDMFRQIRPDLEIVTVEEAGHIVVHDQPEQFEGVVRAFLQRHGM